MRALYGFEFGVYIRACCFLLCGMCCEYCCLWFYLLVFATLLTLFSYCAHLVGGCSLTVIQLVQDLMEPKPIIELHAI